MAQYEWLDDNRKWNVKMGAEDDLDVISRAVRKYLEENPDKPLAKQKITLGSSELCAMLGGIIEDGFLEDVKQFREQFIKINNERIKEQELKLRNVIDLYNEKYLDYMNLENDYSSMKNALASIEDAIRAHDGEVIETDSALASAKRAYRFIYEETGNTDKASKAFNSYLLRGINQGSVEKADAEKIIKEAKEEGNKYYWMEDGKPIRPTRRF